MGRALMTQPKILMLDEPTAGVSPIVMDELFDRIIEVARTGIAILMVEQNAKQALNIADKGFVLVQGRNAYTDTAALMANAEVRRAFLGAEMTDFLNALVIIANFIIVPGLPMVASLRLARLA